MCRLSTGRGANNRSLRGAESGGIMKENQEIDNLKIAFKVFLLCLVFIVIIAYTSIKGISSLVSANESFESFHASQFVSVRNLNRIARDLLQIRINMIQELEAAGSGDRNEILRRQEHSRQLVEDYNAVWNEFATVNLTAEGKALAGEWKEKNKNPVLVRERFHRTTLSGDVAGSRAQFERWLLGYRELRDVTYKLIEHQERLGNQLKENMAADARMVIFGSYLLLSISLLIGFVVTIMLARFFIHSTTKNIKF